MRGYTRVIAVAVLLTLSAQAWAGDTMSAEARFDQRIASAKANMMTSPREALSQAAAAENLAGLRGDVSGEIKRATAGWLKGEALVRLNKVNDAAPVTAAALKMAEHAAPGTKLVADLYRSQGNMFRAAGQVEFAYRDFQIAHRIYQRVDVRRGQAMALQNIGQLYLDANDYTRVLYYYDQSADAYSGDPALTLTADNNRAEALGKLGRYKEAWPRYETALTLANKLGSTSLATRILANLAEAQVRSGDLAAANATVDRGLANAAGEGAQWRPFLFGVKARVELKRGNLASAAQWIALAFDGQDLAKTPVAYEDLHEVAYQIFSGLQDYPKALAHLAAFKRLDDKTRALTASTSAALVAANFDFANQNLRIGQLKAGQIVRDALIAQADARTKSIVLGGALGAGGVVLVLLSIGLFSLRRSRNEVRAANQNLSATNAALEAALAAKTQFLATTSHEIRTPLNGILGMTEVILSQPSLDSALRDRLGVVHGAGKIMRALVDDILDVAKMEHGQMSVERAEIALPELLRDVGRLWETQARAKGVEVEIDLAQCPSTMIGDEARLRQIVFNLMSNAVKFTQSGSVRLCAALSPGASPHILVTVRDSGIGIPEDKLDQIFEAFSQVDGGTTRRFGGTGLGLAICRNVARAMGGDVSVSSEIGKGSAFELTLPYQAHLVAQPGAGAQTIEKRLPPAGLAQASVLVVERNPLTQSLFGAILEPRVGSATFAGSVEEAHAAMASQSFDHIVIDVASLATAEIADAVATVRDGADGAALTLLSPELAPDVLVQLARLGIERILTKPVHAQQLLATLEAAHNDQQNLHISQIGTQRDAA